MQVEGGMPRPMSWPDLVRGEEDSPTKSCDFVGRSLAIIHILRCFFRISEL